MVNPPQHPAPPAPARPLQPHQQLPVKPSGDLEEPQKYKRPLPLPGDKDYVAGQPISDEEADKVEKEQADKHAAVKAAAQKAAAEPDKKGS